MLGLVLIGFSIFGFTKGKLQVSPTRFLDGWIVKALSALYALVGFFLLFGAEMVSYLLVSVFPDFQLGENAWYPFTIVPLVVLVTATLAAIVFSKTDASDKGANKPIISKPFVVSLSCILILSAAFGGWFFGIFLSTATGSDSLVIFFGLTYPIAIFILTYQAWNRGSYPFLISALAVVSAPYVVLLAILALNKLGAFV